MKIFSCLFIVIFCSCNYFTKDTDAANNHDSIAMFTPDTVTFSDKKIAADTLRRAIINKVIVSSEDFPLQLIEYAKTLTGTPYKYASIDPAAGLDCSGFITHVFNHFGITVPRSSVDFTNYGATVDTASSKPGDLILFTGTDSASTIVGHMGIIIERLNGEINFIHSTSGKAYGVTITPLNKYYLKRFVKIVRIPFAAA